MNTFINKNKDMFLASISGVLLFLGFPQFNLYPLSWIALAPLLIALRDKNAMSSFHLGLLTGFIYFVGTIYWVYHSMHFYGGLPLLLSILLMLLLSFSQALYTSLFAVLFGFLAKKPKLPAVLSAPLLWVTLEYIRTYTIFSFPWSSLGYSQYKFLSFIQIADITGIYGISFLVAASSGIIYDVIVYLSGKRGRSVTFRWHQTLGICMFVLVIILSLYYGREKLKESKQGASFRASVIQSNIDQGKKWDLKFQQEVIDTHKRLSIKALQDSPDIIIWPESAVPFIFNYDKTLAKETVAFQRQLGTYLLFGSVMAKDKSKLSNSAVLLSPEGDTVSVYDKMHLVPYGEYVPLKDLFPFVSKMVTAIGDFAPGQETTVMKTTFARIGNLICYEIIFPGLVRKFVDKGANVLVTITNDAWFGRTFAPYQHFSMAVFRAIENRVPVVRAANTGISGFIDSKGRILNKSNIFIETVLTEEITVGIKKSFYTKYGDIFSYLCILISVSLIISAFMRRSSPGSGPRQ
jgi:apolipoprotein N-acyltransferase